MYMKRESLRVCVKVAALVPIVREGERESVCVCTSIERERVCVRMSREASHDHKIDIVASFEARCLQELASP